MTKRNTEDRGDKWEILNSEYLIKDRWLTLRSDNCRTVGGLSITPYYVLEYPTWVNVLAFTPERSVVLVNQYRHGIRRTILELPGGAVDEQDASILAGAQRELLEETGYAAENWREIGTLAANPSNHTNSLHSFLAFNARYVAKPQREPTEQIEVQLIPWEELLERAYQGELPHPHHAAALFFALRALSQVL